MTIRYFTIFDGDREVGTVTSYEVHAEAVRAAFEANGLRLVEAGVEVGPDPYVVGSNDGPYEG